MKRKIALLLGVAALATAALAASRNLTVSVDEAKIRRKKQFFAPVVATVHLGQTLEAGDHEDGWYSVSYNGQEGWLHESAVAGKASSVKAGKWSGSDSATSEEVTLAGKGFNDEVEKSYKKGHADLDFKTVDKIANRSIPEPDLRTFMKAGKTLPKGAQ
jgi:uncharacterized protein YgiM (DUF1202 family)